MANPAHTDTGSVTCTPSTVSRLPLSQVVCQHLPPSSTLPRRQDRSTQPMSTYLFTSRDFMTGLVRCCCWGTLHAPGKKELIQTLRCLKAAARPVLCCTPHPFNDLLVMIYIYTLHVYNIYDLPSRNCSYSDLLVMNNEVRSRTSNIFRDALYIISISSFHRCILCITYIDS